MVRSKSQEIALVMGSKPDYYRVLGISRTASKSELKKAYHRLARQYHPDVSQAPDAEDRFKLINEAYQILSNQASRANYDQYSQSHWRDGRAAYPDYAAFDEFISCYFDAEGNIQREHACLFNCPHCGQEATVFFDQTIRSWQNYIKQCDVCAQFIAIDYEIRRNRVVLFEVKICW